MYILIVEDDPVQYNFIQRALDENEEFPVSKIERLSTESEFRKKFKETTEEMPDVIIMDVMLRWTDPSPKMELPPKEIKEQGFYRAGIRCVEMLMDKKETKNIPVIIYSVLDKEDLEDDLKRLPQAKYIFKDFEVRKITNAILPSMRRKNLMVEG